MNATAHQQRVRPTAVAGLFYPSDPDELRRLVRDLLAEARSVAALDSGDVSLPRAVIAPHAGLIYSGPVAASAYARWTLMSDERRSAIRRVLLIGPSHRVAFDGLATSSADAFATPLGPMQVDRDAVAHAMRTPDAHVVERDDAHAREHSLEVHLPFVHQAVSPAVMIVPMLLSRTTRRQIAILLEALWDEQTLVVISSDLSHYHDDVSARAIDGATQQAIEAMRGDAIEAHQACGRLAIQGLIDVAHRRGLRAATVDLRNSADSGHADRQHVVGYGAFVFA